MVGRLQKQSVDDWDEWDEGNQDELLAMQKELHAELSDDLVRMAQQLKSNTLAFKDILTQDAEVVGEVQNEMTNNLTKLHKEGVRLGEFSQQSSKTTALTWTAVFLVCVGFALTYGMIKVFPKQT